MNPTPQTDSSQVTRWNGPAGRAWVEHQELLDRVFKPLEEQLAQAARAANATRVLDVGCGTGSTTVAVAQALGEAARSTGIDISDLMIAAARARAEREGSRATFICANAQAYAFEPASFDMIVSRFGVMFFDNAVQAFDNLRRAATGSAGLRFLAWRSVAENPFMTTAEKAAASLLNLPAREPDAPGQFGFADPRLVQTILKESGWTGIDIRPLDVICSFPEKELVTYFTRLGPVGLALQEIDHRTREEVIEQLINVVRPAFDQYVSGPEVRFTAACWMVAARAR